MCVCEVQSGSLVFHGFLKLYFLHRHLLAAISMEGVEEGGRGTFANFVD